MYFIINAGLDLHSVTVIFEFDLGIVKIYLYTKNELSMSKLSNRHTDTPESIIFPRALKIKLDWLSSYVRRDEVTKVIT